MRNAFLHTRRLSNAPSLREERDVTSSSLPRILFLSHSPYAGGAQRCLELLLTALGDYPCQRLVAIPPKRLIGGIGLGDGAEPMRRLGLPIVRSPVDWWLGSWPRHHGFATGLQKRVNRLIEVIRQQQIDLVFTNTATIVEGALAARACGVRHVWHVLEMVGRDPVLAPFLPIDELNRILIDLSDRVVVVSEAVKRNIATHHKADNICVVHTGLPRTAAAAPVPRDALLGIPLKAPLAVYVGVLSERKGVDDLIEAVPTVLDRVPDARLILVGPDAGRRSTTIRRIRELQLRDAVTLLGPRDDIPAILRAGDVLVLPSHADPLPLVVLEAMEAGMPVVATQSGGAAEMVVDGETGLLVPVNNPARLGAALAEVLVDAQLRDAMSRNAEARFSERFSLATHGKAIWRVLQVVLQQPAPAVRPAEMHCLIAKLTEAARASARSQRKAASGRNRLRQELMALLCRHKLLG